LLAAGGKNRPATAAVAKATQNQRKEPRAPPDNINDWKLSDVKNWLKNNGLEHLRSW